VRVRLSDQWRSPPTSVLVIHSALRISSILGRTLRGDPTTAEGLGVLWVCVCGYYCIPDECANMKVTMLAYDEPSLLSLIDRLHGGVFFNVFSTHDPPTEYSTAHLVKHFFLIYFVFVLFIFFTCPAMG